MEATEAARDADEKIREAARAKDRDRVAGLLLRHHGPRVLGVLKRKVSAADAEDAFQEAAIAVVRRLVDGQEIVNIGGYFLTAGIYQAERIRGSFWNRLFRRADEPGEVVGEDPRAEPAPADSFDVSKALDALDLVERVVVQMRLEGVPHEDIARCVGKSPAAVMQIASRATAKLRRMAATATGGR